MGSDPVTFIKAFDRRLGIADIHLLPHQTMRGTVEVVFHLEMVIDVQPYFLDMGKLIMTVRQGEHGRAIQFFKATCTGARQFFEGAVV